MRAVESCCVSLSVLLVTMAAKPIVAGLLQEQVRPAFFGCIQSVAASTTLIFSGPVGRCSDLRGRNLPLFIALCLLGASFLGAAALGPSTFALCQALIGLQVFRYVDEILKAAVADVTDVQQRLGWMQALFACGGVGFGIGPMLGKWAHRFFGFQCTLLALSCVVFIVAAWRWARGFHDKPKKDNRTSNSTIPLREVMATVLGSKSLRLLFLMRLFQSCAAHVMFSTLVLFIPAALGEPKERYADLLSFNSAVFTCVQVAQPLLAWLFGMSCHWTLALGMVIIAASRILFALCATTFITCAGCYAFAIVGIALYMPAVSAATTSASDPDTVGLILGLSSTMETIAETVMPVLGGLAFEIFGPYGPCRVAMVCSIIAAVPALVLHQANLSDEVKKCD